MGDFIILLASSQQLLGWNFSSSGSAEFVNIGGGGVEKSVAILLDSPHHTGIIVLIPFLFLTINSRA